MKSNIIHLDGADKTGKDTVRNKIIEETNGNTLIYNRSHISQIAYSIIYNRNIDIDFFMRDAWECYCRGNIFIVLECSLENARKRFIKHNEKDLHISQFEKHLKVFNKVIEKFVEMGIEVHKINTDSGISETVEKIINLCQKKS